MSTLTDQDLARFSNHEVIDDHGDKIGNVIDVVHDDATLEPRWMVVDPGPMRAEHYLPVWGAYLSGDHVVTPFEKRLVRESPKAGSDHLLTDEADRELRQYYGMN